MGQGMRAHIIGRRKELSRAIGLFYAVLWKRLLSHASLLGGNES